MNANRTPRSGRRAAALAAAALLAMVGCSRPQPGGAGGGGPDLELVSLEAFPACDDLRDYLHREGARLVGSYGLAGQSRQLAVDAVAAPSAAAAEQGAPGVGSDYSGTNVQEAGVDEPDTVKTDGRLLVTVIGGGLRVVDVSGFAPVLLATLPLPGASWPGQAELLMVGDRVLALHPAPPGTGDDDGAPGKPLPGGVGTGTPRSDGAAGPDGIVAPTILPAPDRFQVTTVDISTPTAPVVRSELVMDGTLVSARMVDGVARLVLRSGPPFLPFVQPSPALGEPGAAEANRRLVAATDVEDWLPGYDYSEPGVPAAAASGLLGGCSDVSRPEEFSGLDMVSVVTVDAADPRPGPAATVLGAGEIVYASARSLYVTSTRWDVGPASDAPASDAPAWVPVTSATDVHRFDITDKVRTSYEGSGRVAGRVLNQFSMSEHEGDLRVATTVDGAASGGLRADGPASESQVVVLRHHDGRLVTVGRVGGLGRGEQIYSVRFIADRGYVVTFRQTDPLYVIDLSDPARPAVTGELKIPGYSAYLHPAGDHRLLGVGQDATDQGRVTGTQLSLFDVSDPAAPARLSNLTLDAAHSTAEFDHHAFLYWPATGLVVLPVESYGPGVPVDDGGRSGLAPAQSFVGAVAVEVGDTAVAEKARLVHPGAVAIDRSLVVGGRLLTLSGAGIMASDLGTLAQQAWLGY